MRPRTELQTLLEELLGSRNVYFQPPSNIRMKYPAIVYSRSKIQKRYADGEGYSYLCSYDLTLISKDGENPLIAKLLALPYCSYDRNYVQDNLYHDTFTIYY